MKQKNIFLLLFILIIQDMRSQINFYEKGKKTLYWGISLGLNQSNFRVDRQPISSANDTIRDISSRFGPGFNLGIIANWQFNRYFDLRFIPSMVFGEKIMQYNYLESSTEQRINTTYLTFPLMVRFKSEPINDWRLFLLAGVKYEYNIIPQVRTLNDPDRILLKKNGLNLEYGVGLQYFFPYFIFSPEIKFSHSLFNMLDPNQSDHNNSALRGLYPRALTFSLNFEG